MNATSPAPVFDHLLRLTDRRGTLEHARFAEPLPEHGYCTDDVARVLVVTTREPSPERTLNGLAGIALRFLNDAQALTGADQASHLYANQALTLLANQQPAKALALLREGQNIRHTAELFRLKRRLCGAYPAVCSSAPWSEAARSSTRRSMSSRTRLTSSSSAPDGSPTRQSTCRTFSGIWTLPTLRPIVTTTSAPASTSGESGRV